MLVTYGSSATPRQQPGVPGEAAAGEPWGGVVGPPGRLLGGVCGLCRPAQPLPSHLPGATTATRCPNQPVGVVGLWKGHHEPAGPYKGVHHVDLWVHFKNGLHQEGNKMIMHNETQLKHESSMICILISTHTHTSMPLIKTAVINTLTSVFS